MKETTIFREAFGNSPMIRVLDFLLEGRELDYSLTDISKGAGVGWTTLHRLWARLLKFKVVEKTRNIGRAKLFRINKESEFVKNLVTCYDSLLLHHAQKSISEKVKNKKELTGSH